MRSPMDGKMNKTQRHVWQTKCLCSGLGILLLVGCQKSPTLLPSDCLGSVPKIKTTPSTYCGKTGSVSIALALTGNYSFQLNGGRFQQGSTFTDLAAGTYRLTILSPSGCTWVDSIAVPADPVVPGPLFLAVKRLFAQHCLGCHSGNNPQAGLDLSRSCDIENHWKAIESRAVEGSPSPMPQAGLLPTADRKRIAEWIAAGHSITH